MSGDGKFEAAMREALRREVSYDIFEGESWNAILDDVEEETGIEWKELKRRAEPIRRRLSNRIDEAWDRMVDEDSMGESDE